MDRATLVKAAVCAASVVLVAGPWTPSAPATTHVRSGTIVGGLGFRPAMDCRTAKDCSAWRFRGCPAQLTGADPALETSIVDVRALADGRTRRLMVLERAMPLGNVAGGVIVEFWRANCTQVSLAHRVIRPARFEVPRGAQWMTVVGSDNEFIRWRYA